MEELISTAMQAVFSLISNDFAFAVAVVVPIGAFGLAYGLMLGRIQRK